jgi:ATP-dependent helicase IRC3
MTVALREYQTEAIDAFRKSEWQRSLIVLSTGMGKTITGLALAREMNCKMLWLAHREELISQPVKAKQLVWPDAQHGIVKADQNQYMRQIVFASIQSAQQPTRIAQLAKQNFGLVVVDEAHRALSPGYRALLEALGCFADGGPRLLGLTATPERSDNGALDEVFQGIVYQVGITSAIAGGFLVPPRVVERSINIDLDAVSVSRGDYGQKELDLALMQAGIVQEITDAYCEHCTDKKTIIFVISVAQSEAVCASLRARGHAIACVSGETPKEERRSILKKFATGELRCVANCMVLTEGFDEPSVDAIILGRPTQSKPLAIQCVGRGLRLYPNKTECLVVDMVGVSKRHSMVQAAVLFGIKPDPAHGGAGEGSDADEFWRQRFASQIKGVRGAPRAKLHWIDFNDGTRSGWMIVTPLGTIRMCTAGEEWTIDVVDTTGRFIRLSDAPVDLSTAQAIAEDYIRRVNAVAETQRRDTLMSEPATAKQIAYLRRRNVPIQPGLTKKQAARLFAMNRG